MPPDGIAIRMLLSAAPLTKKPPPLLKFEPWKFDTSRTMIVSTGMITFHVVIPLLARANQRMPTRFRITKMNIRMTAAMMPLPDSVFAEMPFTTWLWKKWRAQCAVDRYWIAASTSIGATVAAWRYDAHPNVAPAKLPNA